MGKETSKDTSREPISPPITPGRVEFRHPLNRAVALLAGDHNLAFALGLGGVGGTNLSDDPLGWEELPFDFGNVQVNGLSVLTPER